MTRRKDTKHDTPTTTTSTIKLTWNVPPTLSVLTFLSRAPLSKWFSLICYPSSSSNPFPRRRYLHEWTYHFFLFLFYFAVTPNSFFLVNAKTSFRCSSFLISVFTTSSRFDSTVFNIILFLKWVIQFWVNILDTIYFSYLYNWEKEFIRKKSVIRICRGFVRSIVIEMRCKDCIIWSKVAWSYKIIFFPAR